MRRLLALLTAAAAPGAAALAAQQQPAADLARLCSQANNPARFPDARPRVQAVARQGGAGGAFAEGCLLLADDKYAPAAAAFERAVQADERNAVYHFFLGQAYGAQAQRASLMGKAGYARKVKAAFDRAVQLDPDYLDAREGLMQYYLQAPGFLGGSEQKAREQAYEIRKRAPYRGALLYTYLAERAKDRAGAARELEAMTRQFPDSVQPYTQLAAHQAEQKQWAAAWGTVDRLARVAPNDRRAWYAAGRTAALSGEQLDRGAAALQRYVAARPGPGEPPLAGAHWRLGMIRERQGRRDEARAEYEAAVRADPTGRDAKEAKAALDRLR